MSEPQILIGLISYKKSARKRGLNKHKQLVSFSCEPGYGLRAVVVL